MIPLVLSFWYSAISPSMIVVSEDMTNAQRRAVISIEFNSFFGCSPWSKKKRKLDGCNRTPSLWLCEWALIILGWVGSAMFLAKTFILTLFEALMSSGDLVHFGSYSVSLRVRRSRQSEATSRLSAIYRIRAQRGYPHRRISAADQAIVCSGRAFGGAVGATHVRDVGEAVLVGVWKAGQNSAPPSSLRN